MKALLALCTLLASGCQAQVTPIAWETFQIDCAFVAPAEDGSPVDLLITVLENGDQLFSSTSRTTNTRVEPPTTVVVPYNLIMYGHDGALYAQTCGTNQDEPQFELLLGIARASP